MVMGYDQKITIYGDFIEYAQYERPIETDVIYRPRVAPQRVYDPFKKRRLNNVYSAKRRFVQRVLTGLASLGSPLFVTFTYVENFGDIYEGNRQLRMFFKRLRKVYPSFHYVAVPEFQERGALHYHVLLFGLPSTMGDLCKGTYKAPNGKRRRKVIEYGTERSTRFFAGLWGHGFVDVVRTDGSSSLAGYLAKYMVKAGVILPSSIRSYNFSLGFPKVQVITGTGDYLLTKFHEKVPLYESRYSRPWLGSVIKKTYVRD